MRTALIPLTAMLLFTGFAACQSPATAPAIGKLPHIQVDIARKQVRIECISARATYGLEFFCCSPANDYEAILSTAARPSQVHLALLMLGLKAGEPARYSEAAKKWSPAYGPPLKITCEYQKDNKTIVVPAYRMLRSVKNKQTAPPLAWVFAGSHTMEDGTYAADSSGVLVSLLTSDLAVIALSDLASTALESREWGLNPDTVPDAGTTVWMVIEPAGALASPPAADVQAADAIPAVAPPATEPTTLPNVSADDALLTALRRRWVDAVSPHASALRQAAQTHYEVIQAMRKEQQRLIDEADRIQRMIDELEKQYQDMTTPQPEQ